jgi:hypothetical protein
MAYTRTPPHNHVSAATVALPTWCPKSAPAGQATTSWLIVKCTRFQRQRLPHQPLSTTHAVWHIAIACLKSRQTLIESHSLSLSCATATTSSVPMDQTHNAASHAASHPHPIHAVAHCDLVKGKVPTASCHGAVGTVCIRIRCAWLPGRC